MHDASSTISNIEIGRARARILAAITSTCTLHISSGESCGPRPNATSSGCAVRSGKPSSVLPAPGSSPPRAPIRSFRRWLWKVPGRAAESEAGSGTARGLVFHPSTTPTSTGPTDMKAFSWSLSNAQGSKSRGWAAPSRGLSRRLNHEPKWFLRAGPDSPKVVAGGKIPMRQYEQPS